MHIIKTIRSSHLNADAHYQFMQFFRELLDKHIYVKSKIPPDVLNKFYKDLDLEFILLHKDRKKPFTAEITASRLRINRAFLGISLTIKSALRHHDKILAEAARVLMLRLKPFGKINRKSYMSAAGSTGILVSVLQEQFLPQITLLKLNGWVEELASALKLFNETFNERFNVMASQPDEKFCDVRAQTQKGYQKIIIFIESIIILDGIEFYEGFVNDLNEYIKYTVEHSLQTVRKDVEQTIVDQIPVKTYTGHPVTFIPRVHYVEEGQPDVLLNYSINYEVGFRNNINPGNAQIIIRGKGKYRGRKEVTFNIVKEEGGS
jgi:hypothetical protein